MFSGWTAASTAVPMAYVNIANQIGVPSKILYAMALQESRLKVSEDTKPWPWTLNVKGQGVRLNSFQETVQAVEKIINAGSNNVDVGLMQVNFHYHGARFDSISDAVHPYRNITVAAEILKDGSSHANRYQARVKKIWESLGD